MLDKNIRITIYKVRRIITMEKLNKTTLMTKTVWFFTSVSVSFNYVFRIKI